jgi:hypothetical protein
MTQTMDGIEYKVIPTEFKKKGFNYRQIKREGSRAIFEQTRSGSDMKCYEVVKIGRHNGYTMGGVFIAAAETYPGSSVWGLSAWTYQTLEMAECKYLTL